MPHLSAQINTTYFINRINNLFCKDMKNIPLSDICYPKYPSLKQLFRIMRISIFLLFFSVLGMMAESGHSQNARVTINRNNVQLESILNDIESQTDYLFLYKGNLDVTVRKSIHVSDKTVTEVLSTLLSKSPITYEIEGNHIILVERKEQEIHQNIVSGIVTDASGEPLVGDNGRFGKTGSGLSGSGPVHLLRHTTERLFLRTIGQAGGLPCADANE